MLRVLLPGLFGFVIVCVHGYAIVDVIATDRLLIRNIGKIAWLMVVLLLPMVGSIAWFAFGRPLHSGFMPGSVRRGPSREWRDSATAVDGPRDWVDRARAARSETESDEESEHRLAESEADRQHGSDDPQGQQGDSDDPESGASKAK